MSQSRAEREYQMIVLQVDMPPRVPGREADTPSSEVDFLDGANV
jgi:hypothetical protein